MKEKVHILPVLLAALLLFALPLCARAESGSTRITAEVTHSGTTIVLPNEEEREAESEAAAGACCRCFCRCLCPFCRWGLCRGRLCLCCWWWVLLLLLLVWYALRRERKKD